MVTEAHHAPMVRAGEIAPANVGRFDETLYIDGPDIVTDSDHSGLIAWVDDDGIFYAVGADDVARAYGDGEDEAARLLADMAEPATALVDVSRPPPSAWKRFITAIEPWYDWGKKATIFRLNTVEHDFTDESVGEGYEFRLQWFGMSVTFVIGRTPPKIGPAEVAARKALRAARTTGDAA